MKNIAKFLLVVVLCFFSATTLWGQVVSETTYNTPSTSSLPTGWSGSDGGGTSYIKLTESTHYIQTSEFGQNGFTSIKIKARKFGGPSDAQALITVSWYTNNTETVLGTVAPSNTTLTDYTISSVNNPTGNTNGYIKIQCKGASNSKGSGVSAVTITYTAIGGAAPTTYTVTFDAGDGTFVGSSDLPNTSNTVVAGSYTLPSATPATGYTFDGWLATGITTPVTGSYTVSGDVAFTASYSQNSVGGGSSLTFDFEDNTAHRTSGTNSYTTNSYEENGVDISLTYADAVTDGSPLSGSANVKGRIAKNTTNSPVILIGPIDISSWTVTGISYKTKGVGTMSQVFSTSLDGTNWTTQKTISSMPTSAETETVNNLSITGANLYLKWTVSVSSSTGSNRDFQLDDVVISYTESSNPSPSISASNVDIAYNSTSGSISFTLNNEVSGGQLSASVPSGSWLTLGTVGSGTVPFTCSANNVTTARSETVTLTYTYNTNETVTKDVTVTQAAAPVIYSTIPSIFAAATGTETSVLVTFDSWVVSGVSTNGKNVFVTDNNGNGFVIYYTTDQSATFAAGDILSGTAVSCDLKLYNGFAELLNLNASDLTITAGGTVSAANIAMANLAGVNTGALVSYENLECSLTNNKYYLSDGTTTLQAYNTIYAFNELEDGKQYNITGVYQQYNSTKEILPRSSADIEEVVVTVPTINASNITIEYDATSGEIPYTISNPVTGVILSATESADWISDIIVSSDKITFTTTANEGNADRSANITLSYTGADDKVVTVTQKHYVIDYATLPFSWDDETTPTGVTNDGVGTYKNSPYLKFDTEGDYIILKINERPGTLTFDVKGNPSNGSWAGTFKVQTSVDGTTYTDLAIYEDLTSTVQHESFNNLGENVRYIKWIYSTKTSGNVALGNISLAAYVAPASSSITVDVNGAIAITSAGEDDGSIGIAFENITISDEDDFGVQFYDENNQELNGQDEPDWLVVSVEADPSASSGYVVSYVVDVNDGVARTAYFKVFALDGDANSIYSNLVTITQAAYEIDYATLPFSWAGGTSADLLALTGVTANSLGSDYADSHGVYRVKFDSDGDYIQIKTDGQPGKVTIGVKMIGGGSTSTITVQESSDGETFTNVETLEISGSQNTVVNLETSTPFNSSSRYIRLLFTKGSNVGVGPISIALPSSEPSIILNTYAIDVPYTETIGSYNIIYANLPISDEDDFGIQFYDENNNELNGESEPDWLAVLVEPSDIDGYVFSYIIDQNNGNEVRTAYFKVWALDGEANPIYSNLVTVTQGVYIAQGDIYTKYTDSSLVEGDYIIYYEGKAMNNIVLSHRLRYEEVTPENDQIETSNASIVWHIAPSGDYWTIRSAETNEYAAGNGIKSQIQMIADGSDDRAKWIVSAKDGNTFEFENDYNKNAVAVNYTLRNNGENGFACYSNTTQNPTGGPLTLYKASSPTTIPNITAHLSNGRYWATFYNSNTARYELPACAQAFTMNSSKELFRLGDDGRVIEANTAVVILVDPEDTPSNVTTKTIELTKSYETKRLDVHGGANVLVGSGSPVANNEKPFVLGIVNIGGEEKLGFFEYNGTEPIPANKAYYVVKSE